MRNFADKYKGMNSGITTLNLRKSRGDCADHLTSDDPTLEGDRSGTIGCSVAEKAACLDCLLDYGNAPVIAWNDDLRITLFNGAFERLTGKVAGDVLGKSIEMLLPDREKERVLAAIRRCTWGERWEQQEVNILCRDGTVRTLLWNAIHIHPESKEAVHSVIAQGYDVTERLAEGERRFRAIFEQVTDSIVLISVDTGAIVEFNDSAHENLGYTRREFEKLKIEDFEVMESEVDVARHITELHRSGGGMFETKHRKKNGETRDVVVSTRVISLEGGRYFLSIWRDNTENRQIAEALSSANEKLAAEQDTLTKKNIALKEVLAQIDHEKRQTATQIQSNVDRIVMPLLKKLETRASSAQAVYVSLIQASLAEITSPLVNRLETQYATLSPREVEICNMITRGLTSKEIAAAFDTSPGTVCNQRKSIRRKLGIANDKVNLRSYLQTL